VTPNRYLRRPRHRGRGTGVGGGRAGRRRLDTLPCDTALELARGADLLVCESTFLATQGDEPLAREYRHMTALDAARLARDASVRTLVLTHFSQRAPDERAFEAEARAIHLQSVAARDGMRIPLPHRRRTVHTDR
jgi:ribonuclease Z